MSSGSPHECSRIRARRGAPLSIGLWVSGMANPKKVLGFLDITGDWDASLMLVMGGAVVVTFVGFKIYKAKSNHGRRNSAAHHQ